MGPIDERTEPNAASERTALRRGLRVDLIIAACALIISGLAMAGTWWQTHVIQQQLSVQVWPYVSVTETGSQSQTEFSISNDGLGPAILRSAVISVDGVRRRDWIDVMHAVLQPDMIRRSGGYRIGLDVSSPDAGSVLRAGETMQLFKLTSTHFAAPFFRAYRRVDLDLCYCAILPGTCWLRSGVTEEPQPRADCPIDPHDLLHASVAPIFSKSF